MKNYQNVITADRVDALEIDSLPKGEFSRMFVGLVESGMGTSIRVPVVVARGKKDGPIFGVTAALHGNELNGIPVIHQLLHNLNLKTLKGTIVAVIVANIPGLLTEQREFNDGVDLNHIMPGIANGNQSQVYAYEFTQRVSNHFDYLVDLHTASEGRVNSLYVRADMSQEVTAQMAYVLRPQIVLHDPPSDYTLRGTLAEQNKPAITVEIRDPQRFQTDSVNRSITGLRRILSHIGMIPGKKHPLPDPPILCSRSYWLYTDRGGLLSVLPPVKDIVEKGELIAKQINVFGDVIREYHAPERGVIIGRSVNPVSQTGSRIVHLGVLMTDDERTKLVRVSDGVVKA